MFDNKGHWIDDSLDVVNAKPDFSGLGIEPKHKQKKGIMTNNELNEQNIQTVFRDDWREKCCAQCKYQFIEFEDKKLPCSFSESTDEAVSKFDKDHGCQGVYEYLQTGVFPERGRK